ncbi:hypothetical protein [Sphingomonas sp. LHG3406-1]|uniref:hypothetical protein n=1 Tax=Sphingomonas sp. LHG3406-1 TaxID=2804617 RepID=UPI0026201D34|nr:hypothetical protein [Sphingomonas sp. LHG3406-1]
MAIVASALILFGIFALARLLSKSLARALLVLFYVPVVASGGRIPALGRDVGYSSWWAEFWDQAALLGGIAGYLAASEYLKRRGDRYYENRRVEEAE